MKNILYFVIFLISPPLAAQVQHEYSGTQEFLSVGNLDHSAFHWKMNRVSSAGDINMDGVQDYLVGVPGSFDDAGEAFVISGKVALKGASEAITLWTLTGNPGDGFGSGLCAVGDLNRDGAADFAVSASAGQYVKIYSGLDGSLLTTIYADPNHVGAEFGKSLAVVDLDGDGVPELAVGDPSVSVDGGLHTGSVELFRLETSFSNTVVATSVVRVDGVGSNWFGADLARLASGTAADYLLVGAPCMESNGSDLIAGGTVHLLRKDFTAPGLTLETMLVIEDTTLQVESSQFGVSLCAVGDIRGNDGVEEFLVGAPMADSNGLGAGSAMVYDTTGRQWMRFDGLSSNAAFGISAAPLGDADGDLVSDFLIGAPGLADGPGSVALFSGADGSVLDTIYGGRVLTHFATDLATAGDVDGDGSRDILLTEFDARPGRSMVHFLRPLHSLPYRVEVQAVPDGTLFAPIHGVIHGPLHRSNWSKRLDANQYYITDYDADFSERFSALKIPNARISDEGLGDLNYIWGVSDAIPGNQIRDFSAPPSSRANLENFHFMQMDERMDAAESIAGHDTIWRIGHDKVVFPGTNVWVDGFHEPPNDFTGFSDVVAGVLKHYNQGWGRALPANPIRYAELWNEPHLDSWSGTGAEFAQLHISVLAALDRELDQNQDGRADNLTLLTPVAPGAVGGFATEFLDTLNSNFDSSQPQHTRLGGVVGHLYASDPSELLRKMEFYDDLFQDIESTRDIFKTGPNLTSEWPKIWLTEWNRSLHEYAFTYASMPYIMNSFFYMNQLYAGEVKRSDGKDMRVRLGGAQFFAPFSMWRPGTNPETMLSETLNNHAGLAWEVYGKTLFQDARQRIPVTGPFHEVQMGDGTNPIKDFTVMAGRSQTEELVVLVVSSMRLASVLDHPDVQDLAMRIPYAVNVVQLGFVPLSVERLVQKSEQLNMKQGEGASLVSIPEFGSADYPYAAWTAAPRSDGLDIQVGDMIDNTYEVIVIRGQAPPDPGAEGPGVNTVPIIPVGKIHVDKKKIVQHKQGRGGAKPSTSKSRGKKPQAKLRRGSHGRAKAKGKHGRGRAKVRGKHRRGRAKAKKGKGNRKRKGHKNKHKEAAVHKRRSRMRRRHRRAN